MSAPPTVSCPALITTALGMVFLNTSPDHGNTASGKLKYLDVSHVFARVIEHIHGATSIADLF